jgi:hypothetical protein
LQPLRVAVGLANQWPLHLIWLVTFWSARVRAHRLLASFPRHYQHRNKTTEETPAGKKTIWATAINLGPLRRRVLRLGHSTSQLIRSSLRFFRQLYIVQIVGIRKADAKNTGQSIQEPNEAVHKE